MAVELKVHRRHLTLSAREEQRLQRRVRKLERHPAHSPAALAKVTLTAQATQRLIHVDLRVRLGPLGTHLVSHQQPETVDQALERAMDDVARQLERQRAQQRGEASSGVPSRREASGRRPGVRGPETP
jgi:ribosome-associated translation inhibitor RaiA